MQIGSFSLIKELNTSLILKTIRKHKSISRADIAKITGLTPATVTNITSELLKDKIILETKLGKSSGGRKPVLIEFNYSEFNVIGVTLLADFISVSLATLDSELIKQKSEKIAKNTTPDAAINIIVESIKEISSLTNKRILGIGVAIEGLIDSKTGALVTSSSLGWRDVNIKEEIAKNFPYPVFVDNDVNALTLGEFYFGSAKDHSDFILLYTGYGIGAGLVNNSRLYRGRSNYALEFGHTIIDINGPECRCGKRGCLQSLASGNVLLKEVAKKGYDKKYFDLEEVTIEKIIEKANNGNYELELLLKDQARFIGVGLANILCIFNPKLIIVSGFIARTNQRILGEIINQVKINSLQSTFNDAEIIFSKTNENQAYKGAVALFLSEFLENPEIYLR